MKKVAFLFLAIILSCSSIWAAPVCVNTLSGTAAIVATSDEVAPKLCTITIRGKIDNKPVDISVTVEADNCAQAAADFLKRMAEK